jgi:AraC-like DNA-binding protein
MHAAGPEVFAAHRVATCHGADDARRVLGEAFLPVEFPEASASAPLGLQLNAVRTGRLTMGFMRFDRAVRIRTSEPDNYHVDIPTAGRAALCAAGGRRVDATQRSGGVFMPGRPVDLDCGDGFAQIALMIPRAELQRELEDLLESTSVAPLEFDPALDLTAGGQVVLQAVRVVDEASRRTDGVLQHPLAVRALERALVHALLFSQGHNHSEALHAPVPQSGGRAVFRAIELLRADPAHDWSVADLAVATATSVRSLQEGFRRTLDTTPTAYLRRLRLERVRDDLVAAGPGRSSVTDVSARWGFTHHGRFAAAYADRFGERPSDTLRASSGR